MRRLSFAPWSSSLLLVLVVGWVVFSAGDAAAQRGPERVFSGQILMSDKPFPTYAKSANAYVAQLRKQSRTKLFEDKEKQQYKVHFAAFLNAPLADLEVTVKLYELAGKSQSLVTSFEQFTDQRGQRAIISKMLLDKKQVGVNRDLLMVMESRGKTLASGRFRIVGEGERATGKVDFTSGDDVDE